MKRRLFNTRVALSLALVIVMTARVFPERNVVRAYTPDELIRRLEALHGRRTDRTIDRSGNHPGTCGFGLRFEIERRWNEFTGSQQAYIRTLLDPTPMQANRVIGHFRIYYDTSASSPNLPALITIDDQGIAHRIPGSTEAFVDSTGKYFNYVWSYQVDTLGYYEPPLDTDGYYHIYIVDLANSGIYGETSWDGLPLNAGQPPRYSTYIRIDKDFTSFYPPTRGIPALKVTAAHEFQHAIHVGSYGYWPDDLYYYELTATWMEQVVFHDVKDYVQYFYQYGSNQSIPAGQFATPDVSFNSVLDDIEFSRCLWGCYLQKRFSPDVIRRTWENMKTMPSLAASEAALNEYGSSFREAFLEWSLWNLNTGPGADTIHYYPDGRLYPIIARRPDVTYNGVSRSFEDTIEVLSSSYHPVCLLDSMRQSCNISPKMIAIISNLDANGPLPGTRYGFRYDMAPSGNESFKPLGNGLFVRVSATDPANWSSQEISTDSGSAPIPIPVQFIESLVCPDPFFPNGNKPLSFNIPGNASMADVARLSIYRSSMDYIVSQELPIRQTPCGNGIQWNGFTTADKLVESGVYFYVISFGGNQYIGKFAVIRQ